MHGGFFAWPCTIWSWLTTVPICVLTVVLPAMLDVDLFFYFIAIPVLYGLVVYMVVGDSFFRQFYGKANRAELYEAVRCVCFPWRRGKMQYD